MVSLEAKMRLKTKLTDRLTFVAFNFESNFSLLKRIVFESRAHLRTSCDQDVTDLEMRTIALISDVQRYLAKGESYEN